MSTLFTKIIEGQIPCHKVAEDSNHLAFLDIMPLKKGHVLVIPKREVDNIFDLSPSELAALNVFAQVIAKAMEKAIACKKIGIVVIGLEVPHAHIHLIPIENVSDIDFSKKKMNPSSEELIATALLISSHL